MDLRRVVPDSLVPIAVTFAVVGLTSIALLYLRAASSFALLAEIGRLFVEIFSVLIAWYAYQMPRETTHPLLPLLPWFPVIQTTILSFYHVFLRSLFISFLQDYIVLLCSAIFLYLLYNAIRSSYDTFHAHAARRAASLAKHLDRTEAPEDAAGNTLQPQSANLDLPPDVATHLRVTEAVRARSRQTSDGARLSMIIMILLVLVGGGASVGLWFFGQLDRIRSLEAERNRLLHLTSNLESLARETPELQMETVKQLRNFVQDNYNQPNSYQALLREIAEKTQTSWPDIAIRTTLAILTLFLVQIFFSVYRYNQHLSNLLAAKAEAFELLGVFPEDRQNLRKEMIGAAKEGPPGFGATPNTPLQELLELLEKIKKSKPE